MKTASKKLLLTIALLAGLCLALYVGASGEDIVIMNSGACGAEGDGSNLTWELDSAGTLTISGTGAMADYDSPYSDAESPVYAPWRVDWNMRERIKKIIFSTELSEGDEFRIFLLDAKTYAPLCRSFSGN